MPSHELLQYVSDHDRDGGASVLVGGSGRQLRSDDEGHSKGKYDAEHPVWGSAFDLVP